MNAENANRASGAALGFMLAILLFIALALAVKFSVNVPAIDADQAATKEKALAEMRANEEKFLTTPGWADHARGLVRVPIDTAMQQVAHDWQNPAVARADLTARAEKAAAPAPVVAPKPSAFE